MWENIEIPYKQISSSLEHVGLQEIKGQQKKYMISK